MTRTCPRCRRTCRPRDMVRLDEHEARVLGYARACRSCRSVVWDADHASPEELAAAESILSRLANAERAPGRIS